MNAETILRVVSYSTATLILLVGVAILTGYSMPDYLPVNFRIITGIMMILYAIYRIIMIRIKKKIANDNEE